MGVHPHGLGTDLGEKESEVPHKATIQHQGQGPIGHADAAQLRGQAVTSAVKQNHGQTRLPFGQGRISDIADILERDFEVLPFVDKSLVPNHK